MASICRVVIFAGFLLAALASRAEAGPVKLSPEQSSILLTPHVTLLRDPSNALTFDQVRDPSMAERFKASPSSPINFGFTPDAVWVRFTLESNAEMPAQWLVELGNTRFEMVDWFVIRSGTLAVHIETGNLRPRPENPRGRFPVLALPLMPKETVEVYLWLRTNTSVNVQLNAFTPEAYEGKRVRASMIYLFSLGAGTVLFILGIIFGIFTKWKGYLVYSLNIANSALVFFASAGFWRLTGLPGWQFGTTTGVPFFMEFSLIVLLVYMRDFLDLHRSMPRLDVWIRRLQWLSWGILGLILVGPYRAFMNLVQTQVILFGVLATSIAAVAFLRGDRTARFYLLAWSAFWILVTIDLIQFWNLIPIVLPSNSTSLIGLVASYTLFFAAMADRVRAIRKENEEAQARALEVQREMNARLEQQVAERTESLRQAKEAAEQANRYKGMFLANMSHEIRTPLSALVGLSQAMCKQSEKRGLPADFSRLLQQIRSGGNYLNVMLTNLLDVSAAENQQLRAHPQRIELESWSGSIRDILEPIAASKQVMLKWEAESLAGKELESDPIRLAQILINLVHNALKFTPPGRTVEVRFERRENHFAFEVADEGPGLPADQQKLLEPYEQSAQVVSGSQHGVGLGLYVVKTNVALLGGQLSMRNRDSGGALFRVTWEDLSVCAQ